MFKPLSFFIGLRYTRAKRRNLFISFISTVSIVGIALGVTVLITVLSVMNGFDLEIKKRVFSMVPPITVTAQNEYMDNWQYLQRSLDRYSFVRASAPFVSVQSLMNHEDQNQASLVMGILPSEEKDITEIEDKIVGGKLDDLKPGAFGIILGETLAQLLNANLGDKITVVTPQLSFSPTGAIPRFKRFTVVGIFHAGNGFGFDRGLSFIHLEDAQKLLAIGKGISGLHLQVDHVFAAPKYVNLLQSKLMDDALVSSWADQFGEFFHAVQLEKTMMFLILLMIIAVAAFNLVSTLMMVVSEKEADIAILRTLGATPKTILAIFMVQGSLIGILGTILGLIGGITLALNVTEIVHAIEHIFNVHFLSSNVYFVNYLPSHIEIKDVIKIVFSSCLLSLIATLYPAWRASKMDPVEALRYE